MSMQEKIDTSSSGGRLVFHMFGALAEFERNLVRERTQAGLNAARARGRKGGRPKMLEPAKRQLAVKLYNEKHTIRESRAARARAARPRAQAQEAGRADRR